MASIWTSIFGGAKKKKKELIKALGPPGKRPPGGKYPYGSAPYYDPAPTGSSKKKATVVELDRPSGRKPRKKKNFKKKP